MTFTLRKPNGYIGSIGDTDSPKEVRKDLLQLRRRPEAWRKLEYLATAMPDWFVVRAINAPWLPDLAKLHCCVDLCKTERREYWTARDGVRVPPREINWDKLDKTRTHSVQAEIEDRRCIRRGRGSRLFGLR